MDGSLISEICVGGSTEKIVWAKVWAKKGEFMTQLTGKFIATLKDDVRYTNDSDTGFQIKVEMTVILCVSIQTKQ